MHFLYIYCLTYIKTRGSNLRRPSIKLTLNVYIKCKQTDLRLHLLFCSKYVESKTEISVLLYYTEVLESGLKLLFLSSNICVSSKSTNQVFVAPAFCSLEIFESLIRITWATCSPVKICTTERVTVSSCILMQN